MTLLEITICIIAPSNTETQKILLIIFWCSEENPIEYTNVYTKCVYKDIYIPLWFEASNVLGRSWFFLSGKDLCLQAVQNHTLYFSTLTQ